jgi:Uma2 family endonuclease
MARASGASTGTSEAVVTPPSGGQAHLRTASSSTSYAAGRRSTGDGGLLLQDMFIRLSNEDYLAPDLAWWAATRRPTLVRGALDIVPDLVAEVLSPATRSDDLGAKKDAYLAAGARELWLADPQAATITAVEPDGGRHTVGRGDPLTSPLLRGFAVDVARVFLA